MRKDRREDKFLKLMKQYEMMSDPPPVAAFRRNITYSLPNGVRLTMLLVNDMAHAGLEHYAEIDLVSYPKRLNESFRKIGVTDRSGAFRILTFPKLAAFFMKLLEDFK